MVYYINVIYSRLENFYSQINSAFKTITSVTLIFPKCENANQNKIDILCSVKSQPISIW